jgi:hypothetical protein
LAIERRIRWVISEPPDYVGSYDGHARPCVEHNRDNQRRTAVGGFEKKINDNG